MRKEIYRTTGVDVAVADAPEPDPLAITLASLDQPPAIPTEASADPFQLVPVLSIRTNGGTQMRAATDGDTILDYTRWLEDLSKTGNIVTAMPPLVVFYDGTDYWLADGFHRLSAWIDAFGTVVSIPCHVIPGTRRDAILHAAGANASHGLRRSNADKRRSVETLLRDDEWRQWSDREIARRCQVDHKLVGDVRKALTGEIPSDTGARTYTTKHGTVATMQPKAKVVYTGEPAPAAEASPPDRLTRLPDGWRIVTLPDGNSYGELIGGNLATPTTNRPDWIPGFIERGQDSPMLAAMYHHIRNLMHTPAHDSNFRWSLPRAEYAHLKMLVAHLPREQNQTRIAAIAAEIHKRDKESIERNANRLPPTKTDRQLAAERAALDDLPVVESHTGTWAAGAVGKDRDWSAEKLDAYAEAQEVVPTPEPALHAGPDPATFAKARFANLAALLECYGDALANLSDYEKLTGHYSHRYPLERALAPMIEALEKNLAAYAAKEAA